ncbi:hypothetical protein EBR43_01735 [bacterium]|nr:hypothetical protein [bacterium]NBX72587.1 hypothetical protein [bacterium]
MNILLHLCLYILASYSLIVHCESWMKKNFSSLLLDQKENHDFFIKNIKLSIGNDLEKSSILYAQQAMLTPQGLKMSVINGQLHEHDKNIDIVAQDAFWPFNQKVIYFFNNFSIGDDELSMTTSTLSYNFEENMCFSHTKTYWKTKDMTMINNEMRESVDEIKRVFLRSS